jgi:hypothetical protein
MAVYKRRSQTQSLIEGQTDGKYRKVRPNTTVDPGLGDEVVDANRRGLHPFFNYGFIDTEATDKVAPGETSVKKGKTPSYQTTPVFDIDAYLTQQEH